VQALNDSTVAFIIAHGFGRMPPFAEQLDATDRAAVVAYLRSLASGSKGNTPRNLP
jgi:mono/diheme cytochrome c family protein